MKTRPLVLTFAASNSAHSINKRFAIHAGSVLQTGPGAAIDVETLDLNDFDMPVYSPEREADGIPRQAQGFYDRIGSADGLIIALAEYNGSYTAAFKNIFDWASRIRMRVFQGKPTLLLATSIGKGGGRNVLAAAQSGLPHFGAEITSGFSFGPFKDHFDAETGQLRTPELAQELRVALATFQAALPTLK